MNRFSSGLVEIDEVAFDHSLLQQVVIKDKSCEDHQLEPLMSTAKRVVGVNFFNFCYLTGSCLITKSKRMPGWARGAEFDGNQHLDRDDMSQIVDAKPRLASLIIPFSSVYDNTVLSIVETLYVLRYLCIWDTHFTERCVHWIKSSKATLELCCVDAWL